MYTKEINMRNVMLKTVKYSFLGLTIGSTLYFIPKDKLDLDTILIITVIITIVYIMVDTPLFKR